MRLYSASWVSSAVNEGFQWHRTAFHNKSVCNSPLGWRTEQGQVCVAKLNWRWSLWGLKQPLWISKPAGCTLCVPACDLLGTASPYLWALFLQLHYCCGQSPASFSSWCWSLGPSVTSPRCSGGSGASCSNPSTANEIHVLIMTNTAFPGKEWAQSCLWVAKHNLHDGCPSLPYCPRLSFCQTRVVPWSVWQCARTSFGRRAGWWVCDRF